MALNYITCCVRANGKDIQDMIDRERQITFETFFRKVSLSECQEMFGYHRSTLLLRHDWHVAYYKSIYRGTPCYFLKHSGIEYIFA